MNASLECYSELKSVIDLAIQQLEKSKTEKVMTAFRRQLDELEKVVESVVTLINVAATYMKYVSGCVLGGC